MCNLFLSLTVCFLRVRQRIRIPDNWGERMRLRLRADKTADKSTNRLLTYYRQPGFGKPHIEPATSSLGKWEWTENIEFGIPGAHFWLWKVSCFQRPALTPFLMEQFGAEVRRDAPTTAAPSRSREPAKAVRLS